MMKTTKAIQKQWDLRVKWLETFNDFLQCGGTIMWITPKSGRDERMGRHRSKKCCPRRFDAYKLPI